MKRKCGEDNNVLLAIVTRSFCQHCQTDTVEENVDRFMLFKWRETTGNTRQRNQRICRSSEKLTFSFSCWTLDIICQWLQLTSSSMYKEFTTQVFSSNTGLKNLDNTFLDIHWQHKITACTQREPVYFFSTVSKRSVL